MKLDEFYVVYDNNENKIVDDKVYYDKEDSDEACQKKQDSIVLRTKGGVTLEMAETIYLSITVKEAIEKIREAGFESGLWTETPGEEY